ncbi:MAG TPA: hypothetical protein VGM82_18855 [Gemmatimonadaceae bacterium]|jgi:hypothetical protein
MKGFLDDLHSVTWWLGVVGVGIALNLVSSYIKRGLDQVGRNAGGWWGRRSAIARERREQKIAAMALDPHFQIMEMFEVQRLRIAAAEGLILSMLLFVAGELIHTHAPLWYAVGAIQAAFAFGYKITEMSIATAVREASFRSRE